MTTEIDAENMKLMILARRHCFPHVERIFLRCITTFRSSFLNERTHCVWRSLCYAKLFVRGRLLEGQAGNFGRRVAKPPAAPPSMSRKKFE